MNKMPELQSDCPHASAMILGLFFPEFSNETENSIFCPSCNFRASFPVAWHIPWKAAIHLRGENDPYRFYGTNGY